MTYYGELGISQSASHRAVLSAYRQRALQTHPDKGGSHDAYVRVRQAFEVLSDARQRAEYDAELRGRGLGEDGWSSSAPSGAPAFAERRSVEPLALTGDTPWQLASRTIVSMLDLPETAWAGALEVHTAEVLECCRRQLQRGRDAPNLRGQAAQESSTAAGEGPPIRGLYQTKRGTWEISLSILKVQCAIFNVADIARAHDWHVALVELRQQVDEKMRRGMSDREAFRAAVHDAYEADPELRLVLGFRVSIREARKVINGPFTYRVETALQLRNRVQQLRELGGASHDIDREIRDAKAYEKKQRDLQKARQAAMLQEVATCLEHLRREERRRQMTAPLALPAPEPQIPSALPPTEGPEATSQAEDQTREEAQGHGGCGVRTGSHDTHEEVDPPVAGYAVPLKGFAKFCRGMSLSKGQREELLRRVQDDVEVQRTIREAIARHCGNLRGAPTLALQDASAKKASTGSSLVPVKRGRQARTSKGRKQPMTALVPYQPQTGPRRKGLLELLLEKHEGAFYPGLLTLCELIRVTTTSRRVYSASSGATKRQFTNFSLADFGRTSARSKRGRALQGTGTQLRMLQECLRTRRFALHVQHLDLSTLEMAPISKDEFQYMLGCLPNLASVVLPSRGWAGDLQVRTFVNIAKSLKVSIGASSHADIILRGAAKRQERSRESEGHGSAPYSSHAHGVPRGQKRRSDAKVSHRSKEPKFAEPVQGELVPYHPPQLQVDFPDTPEAPPALKALQALRAGGLRRPPAPPAAAPAAAAAWTAPPLTPAPVAPMVRPAPAPAPPRAAPAPQSSGTRLRLAPSARSAPMTQSAPSAQHVSAQSRPASAPPRREDQHKFWWLDRV